VSNNSEGLDADALLAFLESVHAAEARDPNEGLRDRKKRQIRQKISDVATAMFLIHGFDDVTVAQIAAAADVSEQTVFNYFPTKESMFFDRAEATTDAMADAVRERGSASLVDVVVQSMPDEVHPGQWEPNEVHPGQWEALDEAGQLHLFRLFCEVATGSPTLVAARFADLPRFIDKVSTALAERIGVDPIDPEVQLATLVIAGLIRVQLESTFHHVQQATSFAELSDVVHRDVLRAAQVAEPSLTAFDEMRVTAHRSSASMK
jgi:AcrR family transcriptional regulator